jgi:hypothetical protein
MWEVILGQSASDHVAIQVKGRKYPQAVDYWDANWVDAEISLVIRPWRAMYDASLRTDELAKFREELEGLDHRGRAAATFSPMEPWLQLALELDSLGHVHLRGEAGPEGFGRAFGQARLEFELREFIDQTFLPSIIRQLKAIEREFPIIGKPSD